jgi:cyclopropane-fatty-acyl-phospholipid synthase
MYLLSHLFERFVQKGTLRVIDAGGKLHEFKGTPQPVATIRFHDPSLPRKLFFNPELHAGESYMDGRLTLVDCTLEDFIHLFSINRGGMASYPLQNFLRRVSRTLRTFQQHNPVGKAQHNVAHHYDLSRELYELFLDDDLQYSCAYFLSPGETLEAAQKNKKRNRTRIAEIYDERFCRMWEFYLISVESMFRTGAQMAFQMQLARTRDAAPLTRDYQLETERRYLAEE